MSTPQPNSASTMIAASKISYAVSGKTLFKDLSFGISEKDQIGLIGPNGVGKSTLLKILAGKITNFDGAVIKRKNITIGYLEQKPTFKKDATIYSCLFEEDDISLTYQLINYFGLDQWPDDTLISNLSGGWQKRVALAQELLKKPELLLLDEPTNHLDIETLIWLENFLTTNLGQNNPYNVKAYMLVTHDRLFLQKTTRKIIDVDPRNPDFIFNFNGPYIEYVDAKQALLAGRQSLEEKLKNTATRETEWLRRGPQARLKKQKARQESAQDVIDEHQAVKTQNQFKATLIDFGENQKSPKKLIDIKNVSHQFGDKVIFRDLDFAIGPKTRLGIMGTNGSGKTTFIKLVQNMLEPTSGKIDITDKIEINYFEQGKNTVNPELSILRNVCPDGDYVRFRDEYVFAKSYLKRFNFNYEQMDLKAGLTSGGEQSRLRIAQMMLRQSQVLILDEPTNDLDKETLEVLEDALNDYNGAVLLVTHDRYFMDQVCNQIMYVNPITKKVEFFANYHQWEGFYTDYILKGNSGEPESAPIETKVAKKGKMSFKDKHELENIEAKVLKLEETLEKLKAESTSSAVMSDHIKLTALYSEIEKLEAEIKTAYDRWAALEAMS